MQCVLQWLTVNHIYGILLYFFTVSNCKITAKSNSVDYDIWTRSVWKTHNLSKSVFEKANPNETEPPVTTDRNWHKINVRITSE